MRWIFLLCTCATLSCLNEPDCLITYSTQAKFSCLDKDENEVSIVFDSIRASEVDSTFYKDQKTSSLRLPINPYLNSTSFYFYRPNHTDTLILQYSRITTLISPKCGTYIRIDSLRVSSTTISSINIVSSALHTNANSHVEISF